MQLEPSFFQHNQWYMFGNNRNGRKNSDLTGDVYSKMLPYQARLYVFSLSKIKQYWLLSGGVDYYDPARVRKHASCGHRVKYLKYIAPLSKLVGVLLVIWWFYLFLDILLVCIALLSYTFWIGDIFGVTFTGITWIWMLKWNVQHSQNLGTPTNLSNDWSC